MISGSTRDPYRGVTNIFVTSSKEVINPRRIRQIPIQSQRGTMVQKVSNKLSCENRSALKLTLLSNLKSNNFQSPRNKNAYCSQKHDQIVIKKNNAFIIGIAGSCNPSCQGLGASLNA